MTMQSLQKIINLENELYAAEQAEADKAAQWLKQQQEDIHQEHEQRLVDLEQKIRKVREQAEEDAKQNAAEMVQMAKDRADFIVGIADSELRNLLIDFLTEFKGKIP